MKEAIREFLHRQLYSLNEDRRTINAMRSRYKTTYRRLKNLAEEAGLLDDEEVKMYLDITNPEEQ